MTLGRLFTITPRDRIYVPRSFEIVSYDDDDVYLFSLSKILVKIFYGRSGYRRRSASEFKAHFYFGAGEEGGAHIEKSTYAHCV